ncbi:MAG: hypothetical protein F6J98_40105 [Moorea sp. SIO4G2]|nr:hypothetical protein [Moorena sp. SIO4G2]
MLKTYPYEGLYYVRIISDKKPSPIKPYSFTSAFCLLPSIRRKRVSIQPEMILGGIATPYSLIRQYFT